MSDETFDAEFESLRHHLEAKFSKLLDEKIAELEKKTLLRLRGQPHCRLCNRHFELGGDNPPISEAEEMWHEVNHGERMQGVATPRNWSDVENLVAQLKKRRGGT
jgi:hypothetical protein